MARKGTKNWGAITRINQRRQARARRELRQNREQRRAQTPPIVDDPTPDHSSTETYDNPEYLRQVLQERENRAAQETQLPPQTLLDRVQRIPGIIDNLAGEGTSRQIFDKGAKVISNILLKRGNQESPEESESPADKYQRVDEEAQEEDVDEEFQSPETPSYSPTESVNGDNMPEQNQDQEGMDIESAGGASASAGGAAPRLGRSGGGTGTAGTGGMGVRGQVERPVGKIQRPLSFKHTYTKQYKLRIQTMPIDYVYGTNGYYVRLPFHDLPVDYVGFYLTNQEMGQLSKLTNVQVEHVSCQIYSDTAIIPFETQTSVAAVGNNNVGVGAVVLQNLTNKRWGEIENGKEVVKNIFWGTHAADLTPANTASTAIGPNPPAWLTTRNYDRRFHYYFSPKLNVGAQSTPPGVIYTDAQYYVSHFPWRNYVKKRWNASITEGWCEHWEYVPKNKYLFGRNRVNLWTLNPEQNNPPGTSNITRIQLFNQRHVQTVNPIAKCSTGSTPGNEPFYGGYAVNDAIQTQYKSTANACGSFFENDGYQTVPALNCTEERFSELKLDSDINWNELGQPQFSSTVPNLTIGLEPLISNTVTNDNINAYFEITVETSMTIKVTQNPEYLYLHGGCTREDPFNAPQFKTPQMMTTANISVEGEEQSAPYVTAQYGVYHDDGGFDQKNAQHDRRNYIYGPEILTSINYTDTLANVTYNRRSERLAKKRQTEQSKEKETEFKDKLSKAKKQLKF